MLLPTEIDIGTFTATLRLIAIGPMAIGQAQGGAVTVTALSASQLLFQRIINYPNHCLTFNDRSDKPELLIQRFIG